MSYHSPIQSSSSGKKVLGGGATARMPTQQSKSTANMSKTIDPVGIERPAKPIISMDELGLATEAEKNRKGYLSTYLEGQTPMNKISNFLGSRKL